MATEMLAGPWPCWPTPALAARYQRLHQARGRIGSCQGLISERAVVRLARPVLANYRGRGADGHRERGWITSESMSWLVSDQCAGKRINSGQLRREFGA